MKSIRYLAAWKAKSEPSTGNSTLRIAVFHAGQIWLQLNKKVLADSIDPTSLAMARADDHQRQINSFAFFLSNRFQPSRQGKRYTFPHKNVAKELRHGDRHRSYQNVTGSVFNIVQFIRPVYALSSHF